MVDIETSLGHIQVDINGVDAPITAANFLNYVDRGFFDGTDGFGATTFHRVVAGFVVQGGGYTTDGSAKTTMSPIVLETDVGLSNVRGSLAMARTNQPDSATSQFYVNLVDNTALDGTGAEDGYAVFGTVTEGMDVVDAMGAVDVDRASGPLVDVVITSCERE
ncbi:MAG: peptidyl-prolyl cis-trans isomerase [Myxococcales bacterium]|nr:peptidyl-prolyl cis-trans isomerase [Myxococcales bacterium]